MNLYILFVLPFFQMFFRASFAQTDIRPFEQANVRFAPYNISVTLTNRNPPAVTVNWSYYHPSIGMATHSTLPKSTPNAFRIAYSPYNTDYRYIQEVPITVNSTAIDNLKPNTKYTLVVSSIAHQHDLGNSSAVIIFDTPISDGNERTFNSFSSSRIRLDTEESVAMKPAELAVVALVLLVWLGVIRLFIKKWGKIRTLEPNRAIRQPGRVSVSKIDSCQGSGPIVSGPAAVAVASVGNVCGAAPCKSRLFSFAPSVPRLQMSESQTSLCSNTTTNVNRPRINSVFLTSLNYEPSRPRRYKSAEDLQSVVIQITERQREQRKLSNCSIKGIDEMPKNGSKLGAVAGAVADAMIGLGPSGRVSTSRLLIGRCGSSQSRTSANSDAFLNVNCSFCRRRMSSLDHCSHCGGLMSTADSNRLTALMQSKSFQSHHGSFSSSGGEEN